MNTNAKLPLTSRGLIIPRGQRAWLWLAVSASLVLLGAVPAKPTGDTTRVSVSSAGAEGNGFSTTASISSSGNGRYVAFRSEATNFVPGDTNAVDDVFVHDSSTGLTTRVSVDSAGGQGDGQSVAPTISNNGRYVVFTSQATNLVAGDTNGVPDIFVHDMQTGLTTRVSVDSAGAQANGFNFTATISARGRYVSFWSSASNLVPGDTNGLPDVFVHDMQTGQTTRVSVDSAGAEGNGSSQASSISGDGRYVAFESVATNLVSGDTNGFGDVFLHDRNTGLTTRVSVASDGAQGVLGSARPSISDDGNFIAFSSLANNLVPGDGNFAVDIFVHDQETGLTTRVSVDSAGVEGNSESDFASISDNGRWVAFSSLSGNLVPDDTNGQGDVFVHDRETGSTTLVSLASDGAQGNLGSSNPSISANGRHVAFESAASNLVPDDTNGSPDVFVNDKSGGWGGGAANAAAGTTLH